MKKTARKVLLMACSALLLVCLTVGATVAYLTATTGPVTNTFSVGNVAITLNEAEYDNKTGEATEKRVTQNEYQKILPGSVYPKDPTVTVGADSEDCYVYVKVVNNIASIEAEASDEYKTVAQQLDEKWELVDTAKNIWRYDEVLSANGTAVAFNEFKITDDLTFDAFEALETKTIVVTAAAVQSTNVTTEVADAQAIDLLSKPL